MEQKIAHSEALGDGSLPHPEKMKANIKLRIGHCVMIMATARTTPAGIVSVGVMISAIVLSAAVLVYAARRKL